MKGEFLFFFKKTFNDRANTALLSYEVWIKNKIKIEIIGIIGTI